MDGVDLAGVSGQCFFFLCRLFLSLFVYCMEESLNLGTRGGKRVRVSYKHRNGSKDQGVHYYIRLGTGVIERVK